VDVNRTEQSNGHEPFVSPQGSVIKIPQVVMTFQCGLLFQYLFVVFLFSDLEELLAQTYLSFKIVGGMIAQNICQHGQVHLNVIGLVSMLVTE
jgi:hypothetical protein